MSGSKTHLQTNGQQGAIWKNYFQWVGNFLTYHQRPKWIWGYWLIGFKPFHAGERQCSHIWGSKRKTPSKVKNINLLCLYSLCIIAPALWRGPLYILLAFVYGSWIIWLFTIVCVCVYRTWLSHVWPCDPGLQACQVCLWISSKNTRAGCRFPLGHLPNLWIEPMSLVFPTLAGSLFTSKGHLGSTIRPSFLHRRLYSTDPSTPTFCGT